MLIAILVLVALVVFFLGLITAVFVLSLKWDEKKNKTINDWFKNASVDEINQKFSTANRRSMFAGKPANPVPSQIYELKYVPIDIVERKTSSTISSQSELPPEQPPQAS